MSIEGLQTTLACLQKEKACLQQKLHAMQSKKVMLQGRVEGLALKTHQVKEVNVKMKETLNVAEHKVEQSLLQQNTIQKQVDEKRQSVKDITSQIEHHKEEERKDVQAFQEKLSHLANAFIADRHYYKPENLEKQLAELQIQEQHLMAVMKKSDSDMASILNELEQLTLEKERNLEKADELCIPSGEQKEVLDTIQNCITNLNNTTAIYQQKQATLENVLQGLTSKIEEMKGKMKQFNNK